MWLIDPVDIFIGNSSNHNILNTAINAALVSSNVTINAAASGSCSGLSCFQSSPSSSVGDIWLFGAIDKAGSTPTTLTLIADKSILLNTPITNSGSGALNVVLTANVAVNGEVQINQPITIKGSLQVTSKSQFTTAYMTDITANAGITKVAGGGLTSLGGNLITINSPININGDLLIRKNLSLTTSGGAINITGAISSITTAVTTYISGTSTFTTGSGVTSIEVMVVGGGGSVGGGGGAGGVVYYSNLGVLASTGYTATVGSGGSGAAPGANGNGGQNSIFGAITAIGGGGGVNQGCCYYASGIADNGGSGGGGSGYVGNIFTDGTGGISQGNAGGSPGTAPAGGGNASNSGVGGAGGDGIYYSITGLSTLYATGGGIGEGTGGYASGGNSGFNNNNSKTGLSDGRPGTIAANSGSGGGGQRAYASTGSSKSVASGIVVIRYATSEGSTLSLDAGSGVATIQGNISGATAIIKNGSGLAILSGDNSYTGGTTLTAGTLGVYTNPALGSGALTLAGSTTLLLGRAVTDIANDITLSGSATVAFDTNVDYLIVAGVGRGGGGGASGVLTGTTSLANTSYALTVGAGGAAVVNDQRGVNGGDSSLDSVATATGGGGGGGWTACSGLGGGASGCGGTGDTAVAGQGYAGANTPVINQANGGAGAAASGANGGIGIEPLITGSSLCVGGGGGAGSINSGGTAGTGGTCCGANGKNQVTTGNSGTANTGGVEGYAGTSGAGGSGIIIVRYLGGSAALGGTKTFGVGTATGYSLHSFTTTGSNTLTFSAISAKLSGVISGANRLTVAATPGTLSLTGTNTCSGGTTISSGTLQVGNGGTSGNLGSGGVTNSAALVFNRSNDFTISNAISGTGTLTKSGTGALTLSYANTYTGATTISAGSLTAGIANAIAQSASVTLSDVSGAVFNLGGYDQGIKNLSGGGSTGGNIVLGSNLITITQTSDLTYGGVVSGTNGQLTKLGSSRLTLTGSNTYTGATTINLGTLKIGATGGVVADASAVVVDASGTLDVYYSETVGSISGSGTIYTQSPSSNIVLTMGGDNSSTTFSGNLSMGQTALGYVKTGTGTLTLNGTSTFPNFGSSVAFDINGGAVLLGSSGAFGNLTSNSNAKIGFGGGTLKYSSSNTTDYSGNFKTTSGQAISVGTNGQNVTFASNLTSTSGTLTKLGSGALNLGGTTISAGTLKAGSTTAFGGSAGAITVADGATLDLNGKTLANTNALTLNGAGVGSAGAITNSSATTGTYVGAISLGSASSIGSTSGAITVSGAISDASDYGLAITGDKAVTLSSTSNALKTIASGSSTGALTVVNSGDLAISSVTVGGSTYNGLNSSGEISVKTTGDLTISQNVVTTSASVTASAPALLLAAGSGQAIGTVSKNIKLGGTQTFTVGSDGIIDFYAGDSSGSAGLATYVNAQSPKSYAYSADLTTQPSAAGYNVIYRGAPPYIYVTIVDSQTGEYGTAAGLSYLYSTSPTLYGSAYLPSSLSAFNAAQTFTAGQSSITINSRGLTGSIAISTALTTTTNANAYSLTLTPTLALSESSVVFIAGTAKNFTLNPKALNLTISKTYDGNATFTNANTYALMGMANSESAPTISSGSATLSSANVTASAATSFATNTFALSNTNYTLTGGTVSASISQLSSVTYTGSAGGAWSDGANWTVTGGVATGARPTLGNVVTVIIPVGASVSYGDAMSGLTPTSAVGITNNGAINFTNTGAATMLATMSGTGAVTMAGSAAVTLTATNTYTGTTTINNGATLKLGSANTISNTSAIVVNGTLDLAGYSETVGSIAGASTGLITSAASGTPVLTAGGDDSSTTYAGVIQNGSATTAALTKVGTGTTTLSGASTYTGTTTVSAGTLALGASDVISNSSALVVNGGNFDLGSYSDTVAAVTIGTNGAAITSTTGALTGTSYTFITPLVQLYLRSWQVM